MVAVAYRLFELPWVNLEDDDKRLRKILVTVLAVTFVLGVVMPWIPVPEEERQKIQALPPRLAQLVLEKQKPKPIKPIVKSEPKPQEKAKEIKKEQPKAQEKPKPVEKVKAKPKVVKTPEAKPIKPKVDKVAEARKKAASTGLLAFADELADLRDAPLASALQTAQPLLKSKAVAKTVQRSVLTTGTQGSGGIDTSRLSTGVAGGTVLAGRQTTGVENSLKVASRSTPASGKGKSTVKSARSFEEVTLVMDKNKGAIFSLYNRALRKDPTLQGKVVLEITIAADGGVMDCKLVSSELNNPILERKLVTRIKLLNFGARDVETLVVTYPIDFLPA